MQRINYETLTYSELQEEEKTIVDQYIKELDTNNIEGTQTLTDIETKKLYREQQILVCIQTKSNIELTNLPDNENKLNEDKGIEFFKQFFLSLKNRLQRFISNENNEKTLNISRIRDEFIDIKLELRFRSTKIKIIGEDLRNHYAEVGYKIIALHELEKTLQLNTDNGTISNDYGKRNLDIKRKNQISNTISHFRGIRINIANAIIISESLAQQYEELSENYDESKVFSLLQSMDEDRIKGKKDFVEDTKELISIRFARLEKRINKLYLTCEALHQISASRKTGFIKLKQLKESLYKEYDNIIKTAKYDEYPKLENDIISELAQIECNVEEYVYDTRKYAEEIIVRKIKKIYNSSNYKDFQNIDTEIKNVEAIEELLNYYSSYLETDLKKELKIQVITLKFNLFYRKQVELLIYGNEKNECVFVEDNLSKQEKEWFEFLLKQKIKNLKNRYSNPQNNNNKLDILFEVPINQILYDRVLLERLIITDMRYNAYDYINLLKAKIFNAHLCNIANNPFEPEIYITKEQLNLYYGWGYYSLGLRANKVNYSMLVALLKNIITDENVSIIECDNLYRRFGFKCNPIMFNIGQECIKAIFEQVKWTKEYFEISYSVTIRNKRKLEIPYCKMNIKGLRYYFNNTDLNEEKGIYKDIDNAILLVREEIQKNRNAFLKKINLAKSGSKTVKSHEINRLKYSINYDKSEKSALMDIQNQKKKSTLEHMRNALKIIEDIYSRFNVKHNVRRILPLEDMSPINSQQVYLVEIPRSRKKYYFGLTHTFGRGYNYDDCDIYEYTLYNARPLWLKYAREFNELGIRIHLVNPNDFNTDGEFTTYVNLNDILDLPIDFEKVKFITNKEMKQLEERAGKSEIEH